MKRLQSKKYLCLAVLSRKKCWAQTTWRKKEKSSKPAWLLDFLAES